MKSMIFETAAIMGDYHMHSMGGMAGAWDIWEMAIIPKLMANCGSWVAISKNAKM